MTQSKQDLINKITTADPLVSLVMNKEDHDALELAALKLPTHIPPVRKRKTRDKKPLRQCYTGNFPTRHGMKFRTGFVVGESRDKKCWIVRWDGQKSTGAYIKSDILFYKSFSSHE